MENIDLRTARTLSWVMLLSIGSLMLVSCSLRWLAKSTWEPPRVVAVEGANAWQIWPQHFGVLHGPVKEGQPTHLLLRNGDILVPSELAPFLYKDSDGGSLFIRGDKYRTELKGRTVTLRAVNDEGWEWLEKALPDDLYALRFVDIGGEIPESRLESLKRLSQVNPNVGLAIEQKGTWQQVLPMFDSCVLLLPSSEGQGDTQEVRELLSEKKSVRTLGIDGRILDPDTSFLSRMTNLDTLCIDRWDPSISGPLPSNLNNLRRLIVAESEVRNLALLGNQPHLDELRFEGRCTLESLNEVSNFPELKELELGPCEKIKDLSPLKHLKQLKWLGLPSTTTQQQLESIVRDHPNLVGIELIKNETVTDLRPLEELRDLKFLIVWTPNANLDPLLTMRGLRWLAVGDKEQDKGILVKIQQALPETSVVRVYPLCLGSGWILLLAPGVLLARCVKKCRRQPALSCAAGRETAMGQPVLDGLVVSAGMILFAASARFPMPVVFVSALGLMAVALVMAHSLHSSLALGEIFGLSPYSRHMLFWLLIGCAGGTTLGMFSRVSDDMVTLPSRIGQFVFAASAIGASEELLFRGYIQGRLRSLGPVPAVILAAAVHTAYKVSLFVFLPEGVAVDYCFLGYATLGVGLAAGALREKSRSVLPPLAGHVLFDIVVYGENSVAPWWVWS
jgi:membrane protease YdiL (CAAX protease family)